MVLEIGSGPLISGLVSASSCADLLIYSDLLPTNLAEISRSLTACSPCPFMDYIARQADSYIASISSGGSVSQSSSYELLYLKYSSKCVSIFKFYSIKSSPFIAYWNLG